MLDRSVMRIGALAAMVGAVVAIVFNLLHPRTSELGAEASVAATQEGIWALDHYMLAWTIALGLLAFIVIARSLTSEPSASWGSVALFFGIGSAALALGLLSVDGFSMRVAAETSGTEVALAVAYVAEGLFVATVGSFFGVTPVLYGIAVATGDDYPTWMGWWAIVAGGLGLVTASIIFFTEFSAFTVTVLFPIASLLFTLWIGIAGYMLWSRLREPVGGTATAPGRS